MRTELVRARLTKLEEEIAAFERWQKDSYSTHEHATKKGPRHGKQEGDAQEVRRAHAGRMARYANRPCSCGTRQARDPWKARAIWNRSC